MSLPAGAALGSTRDPQALVVGDASTLDANATDLAAAATKLEDVGNGLKAVRTPGWTGPASTAFTGQLEKQPKAWFDLDELLTEAASQLTRQAAQLRTAQAKAQDAIDLWDKGQAATAAAVHAYDQEQATRAATPATTPLPPPQPFSDPGEAMRRQAQEILDQARSTLDDAGSSAAGKLASLAGIPTPGGDWLNADGEAKGPDDGTFKIGDDKQFGKAPWSDYRDKDDDDGPKLSYDLASISGSANLWATTGAFTKNFHGVEVDGEGSVKVGVNGEASLTLTEDELKAKAEASVGVTAEGKVDARYGHVGVGAEGEAFAGARAEGEVGVGADGVHAEGEAFAGARASAEAHGDVGGVGGSAGAEGWAGVGIGGDADVGFDDGKFKLGFSGGAALGIGGKVSFDITVDPAEVADTAEDVADAIGDGISDGVGAVGDGISSIF